MTKSNNATKQIHLWNSRYGTLTFRKYKLKSEKETKQYDKERKITQQIQQNEIIVEFRSGSLTRHHFKVVVTVILISVFAVVAGIWHSERAQ